MAYDIAADGTVLASGLRVSYAALPMMVRAAAEIYFDFAIPPGALVKVERGQTVYEVKGGKGLRAVTLRLSETGELLEEKL